jgi:putative transposase
MPRKPLIRSSTLPYHVTARGNNREPFHLASEDVWKIFEAHCFEIYLLFQVQVHAFVLMNNHFHLLISTPHEDLGKVMMYFMRTVTRTINLRSGRSGRVFGARYHWSLIDSDLYFAHALKYVYRNPVRAGVCVRAEEYPFSSLAGVLGFRPLSFPLFFPFGCEGFLKIPSELDDLLLWLNQPFRKEQQLAIQKALRRTQFDPQKTGWKRILTELSTLN